MPLLLRDDCVTGCTHSNSWRVFGIWHCLLANYMVSTVHLWRVSCSYLTAETVLTTDHPFYNLFTRRHDNTSTSPSRTAGTWQSDRQSFKVASKLFCLCGAAWSGASRGFIYASPTRANSHIPWNKHWHKKCTNTKRHARRMWARGGRPSALSCDFPGNTRWERSVGSVAQAAGGLLKHFLLLRVTMGAIWRKYSHFNFQACGCEDPHWHFQQTPREAHVVVHA